MNAGLLTATAVRVGMKAILIPNDQPIPDGAVVYGKASREVVYQTFYEATHCRQGHPRIPGLGVCRFQLQGSCSPSRARRGRSLLGVDWTWGVPA